MKNRSTNLSIHFIITTSLLLGMSIFSGCTKKESAPEPTAPQAAETAATPAAAAAPAADANKKPDIELTIGTQGDNLYYDKKELEVKAGQVVKLTFKNSASASSNMPHNWVLTKPGVDQQVAMEGIRAGETKDWVVEGPNVLAYTKLAKPGETVSVIFTAPTAGEYPYVCTFPGHFVTMKGVLKVK